MTCLLCKAGTRLVLYLGETPLANELPTNAQPDKFPLRLVQCSKCQHLQIDHHVSPERLYRSYIYVSNTSQANRDYFKAYAAALVARFQPGFVVDVGGNDGLFAGQFACKALVVDPAANIPCATPRLAEFFDENVAGDIARESGKADLITCNNAFAHNADLVPILRGVKALLADKGTFIFEVAYAMPLLRRGLFDLIYHEHIHHWTLTAAIPFLREHGLDVYDAEEVPTHGGSLRVYARHVQKGHRPKSEHMPAILRAEALDLDDAVRQFHGIVEQERHVARQVIQTTPGTIGLLGYPAKACTLLSYWGIGNDIQHVFDDNEHKIGKRTHFGHVIQPTSAIATVKPDRMLVTSWNYAEELIRRFPGQTLVIPHPFRTQ